MIIDDVITDGTAKRQSMQLIESLGARVSAVTIALDRQEKGQGELSAIQELELLGVQIITIIRLDDIVQHLKNTSQTSQLKAVAAYRERYGID
jgi:orotate phosphoribosyltransferase